jgi:hypothetical protein
MIECWMGRECRYAGSIFWLDEMPSMAELFESTEDSFLIHSMFALRLKLWDGQALNADDQRLWDCVKSQVPGWAFFQTALLKAILDIENFLKSDDVSIELRENVHNALGTGATVKSSALMHVVCGNANLEAHC